MNLTFLMMGLRQKLAARTFTKNAAKFVRKYYRVERMTWRMFAKIFYRHHYSKFDSGVLERKIQAKKKWQLDQEKYIICLQRWQKVYKRH